ncbi:alkylation response protein AidB-like acyl-CoA dehydrogenase [Breoghania corrubedonensis]|uniref:Alkylation response protein AidB-like acyl-CoA dehydrogenase n=1 Tax=Breoghania corrubedonensis TaxID=665038 RepID=A0A2T5VFX0_9HYPH|nr:acyl-CoA dehydrogenase family protein [Breoghania corrubedonensis]PTW62618.1 alkylation response protein AidB-like acyl-CoA dehydrogenase [Breoghania corrubedonensis]
MNQVAMIEEERFEALRLIVESAAGIAPRTGDLKAVRALRFARPGIDRARWREMADMGWFGLRRPEMEGGAGLGMTEAAALATELGASLRPEPLTEMQLALDLLAGTPTGLPADAVILPAWMDAPDALEPAPGVTETGGRISGERRFVALASAADAFVIVATEGAWLVAADAEGLSFDAEDTLDGGHTARLTLKNVAATRLPAPDPRAFEAATLATAAALLGVMERAFAITLDYLKTRVQFGQPIGNFQVLQHRAVDLEIETGITRAVLRDAAAAFDAGEDCRRIVSRAKARASDAAMLITRQAVQMHGAIGYTEEADIGLFLRRAMVLAPRFGTAHVHRRRYHSLSEGRP